MHTYDAQITLGAPQPLPDEVALDGVDEFLSTCFATTSAWPHKATALAFHATDGGSWRLRLSADGAQSTRPTASDAVPGTAAGGDLGAAAASARGTSGELVLVRYGRMPIDSLQLQGDTAQFELLRDWEPEV